MFWGDSNYINLANILGSGTSWCIHAGTNGHMEQIGCERNKCSRKSGQMRKPIWRTSPGISFEHSVLVKERLEYERVIGGMTKGNLVRGHECYRVNLLAGQTSYDRLLHTNIPDLPKISEQHDPIRFYEISHVNYLKYKYYMRFKTWQRSFEMRSSPVTCNRGLRTFLMDTLYPF